MRFNMNEIDLGFAEQCDSEWLTNVYFPSKLGGKPAWLQLDDLPTKEQLKCTKCNHQKSFLCQIYAPFDDEYNFHRTIYVFICRMESCCINNENGNITILRSQLPLHNKFYPDVPASEDSDAVPEILPTNSKLCIACGCIGPLRCSRCKKANYCAPQHQRLHWPFHKLLCSVDELSSLKANDLPISQILFPEWEIVINSAESGNNVSGSKSEVDEKKELQKLDQITVSGEAGSLQDLPDSELEQYAQYSGEVDDKYFRKFRNECQKYPLQIIRYNRSGKELWISDPETTIKEQLQEIPACELCGRDRAFEFQIMPQMLNYLKDTSLDWGVIAVYTCPNSCPLLQDKGYVEECCIKQDIVNK